jgi:hypothetical protein
MINANMRLYDYFTYGDPDEYGQQTLIKDDATGEPVVQGTIKISISNISTTTSDNIKYKDADYIGLTLAKVDDTYVIKYNDELLKVRYVIPDGRYKQVFMSAI